jgi:hypothetical protein
MNGVKRVAAAAAVLALGATPAVATAHRGNAPSARSMAEKQCRQERAAMGKASFAEAYGTNRKHSNAFGKCVSHRRHQGAGEQSGQVKAEENAARQCRTERSADPAAFRTKYGSNGHHANAFGKCVSTTARSRESKRGS